MKEPTHDTVELYKLAVEMADRVSARRGHANQFYLTLQSVLLGAPALVALHDPRCRRGLNPPVSSRLRAM